MANSDMRILIISTYFPPLNSIASLRPYSWAKYWSQAGHDVTVLTTKKCAGEPLSMPLPMEGFKVIEVEQTGLLRYLKRKRAVTVSSEQTSIDYAQKAKNGLKAKVFDFLDKLRARTGIFNGCRMPDFTQLWAKAAWNEIRKQKITWDLVLSTSGPYPVHCVADKLKSSGMAKKWIADFRDAWVVENHVYRGLFPFTLLERYLETRFFKNADLVTTVSSPLVTIFKRFYPFARVKLLTNGFDSSDFSTLSEENIFPDDGKFRIVYTGTTYKKREPVCLFEAIAKMKTNPAHKSLLNKLEVVFVGGATELISRLSIAYDVQSWVITGGMCSRQDALRMQRDAHALLFMDTNDHKVEGILTGKIFEYLSSGTPILALGAAAVSATAAFANVEVAAKLIEENKAGTLCGNDVEKIIRYLCEKLADVKKTKIVLPANVLGRFERKALADQLLQFIMEM